MKTHTDMYLVISIIHWKDLEYLYKTEKSKITFRLTFLGKVLDTYNSPIQNQMQLVTIEPPSPSIPFP